MNVFWLDENPRRAARYHGDQHVNKMLLEAAQLCCTAARQNGFDADFCYRSTHESHPLTQWARSSRGNWLRLREHAAALNAEFRERYDHSEDHASWSVIERIDPDAIEFPSTDPTPRPLVMPEQYRQPNAVVESYRTYYANEKVDMLEWKYTEEPPWLDTYRKAGTR